MNNEFCRGVNPAVIADFQCAASARLPIANAKPVDNGGLTPNVCLLGFRATIYCP
jgi:hypothetical protein